MEFLIYLKSYVFPIPNPIALKKKTSLNYHHIICYSPHVCIPAKIHSLQADGIRRQGLQEVIRSWRQSPHECNQCPYKQGPRKLLAPLIMRG